MEKKKLLHAKHVKYFLRFLNILPDSLCTHDTTRLTIVYFTVSGLDLLKSIKSINNNLRDNIIEWIYRLQVHPTEDNISNCGFQGSSFVNIDLPIENSHYKCGHITMTYTGLCTLLSLGDDLSRVDKSAIITAMKYLQDPDGNFTATIRGSESDMRYVYCAACVSYILDDWSGFNVPLAIKYILNSMSYDFGIGQCPQLESHGGSTFCAIATLKLCNKLDVLNEQQIDGLKRWLVNRQMEGFQGRPNKPEDTCYSYWIGATLKILDALELTDWDRNRKYVFETQDDGVGGFSKWCDTYTDPFHTYLGLGGLSLINEEGLDKLVPSLNITETAHQHLLALHKKWRNER